MSRRTVATLIGALILCCLPFVGEEWRATASVAGGIFLAVLAIFQVFARVPTKYFVGCFRLLALAFAGLLVRRTTNDPSIGMHGTTLLCMASAILGCFALAIGPMFALPLRRRLYGMIMVLSWITYAQAVGSMISDVQYYSGPNLVGIAIVIGFCQWHFHQWKKTLHSPLVELFDRWGHEARSLLASFDSPSSIQSIVTKHLERWGFAARMRLPFGPSMSHRNYQRILRTCRRYPNTPLSWQVAYTAALAMKDFPGATQIVLEAQSRGFGNILCDRALAYAMHASYDPAWRSVLHRGWQKESQEATFWTKESYCSFEVDPTAYWRLYDPSFAKLQNRLWDIPIPAPPQRA